MLSLHFSLLKTLGICTKKVFLKSYLETNGNAKSVAAGKLQIFFFMCHLSSEQVNSPWQGLEPFLRRRISDLKRRSRLWHALAPLLTDWELVNRDGATTEQAWLTFTPRVVSKFPDIFLCTQCLRLQASWASRGHSRVSFFPWTCSTLKSLECDAPGR